MCSSGEACNNFFIKNIAHKSLKLEKNQLKIGKFLYKT